MPNTREKLIELLMQCLPDNVKLEMVGNKMVATIKQGNIADYLIANGVTFDKDINVPIKCQNCKHHDTYTCPENRVWCNMLRRYMSLDGYCSYGEKKP